MLVVIKSTLDAFALGSSPTYNRIAILTRTEFATIHDAHWEIESFHIYSHQASMRYLYIQF